MDIIPPSGKEKNSATESYTERAEERSQEDKEFVPVIVKRTDESVRHPDDILEKAIFEGREQIQRSFISLALSSVAAGLILGFTAMSVAVVSTLPAPFQEPVISRFATAFVYPLGFIICIMSRTQLFTEHTATAVYPVLDGKAGVARLIRLWFTVIMGNMLGAVISAGLLTAADEVIQGKEGYLVIDHHLVTYGNSSLFVSAILAGWLMAMGGWLVLATPPTISQIVSIYIVTFLIGIGGLHHSIAGAVEMFTAFFISDHFSIGQTLRFIGLAITGNLIGGSIFVALLNYGHIRKTQKVSRNRLSRLN
ncbi:MAG: formate/nitrite transporter family protein [Candidatus Electrothrix sp. EH2]|nr:formate/nitrite transporter family protein [Candidatus Electrothrix sp. EH2]